MSTLCGASLAVLTQACHSTPDRLTGPTSPTSSVAVAAPAVPTAMVVVCDTLLMKGWRSLATISPSSNTGASARWEESLLCVMAIDDESVFVGLENGAILRIAKNSGALVALVPGSVREHITTTDLKVDATHVYWLESTWVGDTSHGIVKRVAKTGGSIERIEDALGGAFQAVLSPAEVYYLDPADYSASTPTLHVRKVPKSGGAGRDFSLPEHGANGMVTDGTALFVATNFWEQPEGQPWRIFRLDPRTSRFSRLGFGGSSVMAVDQTHIYWADDSGAVFRMSKAGGVAEKLCTGPIGAVGLVMDETTIYWVTRWSSIYTAVSNVMKVPKAGGEAVMLAEGGGGTEFRIAVDAHNIYWMTKNAVLVHAK